MLKHTINLLWDNEANVWVAESKTIPGLVLESGSLDALIERLKFAVPEILSLNGKTDKELSLCIKSERYEQVVV